MRAQNNFPLKHNRHWHDWRWQMVNRIANPACLADWIEIHPKQLAALKTAAARYPFCVTPYYFSLCHPGDKRDPVLRQFLPDIRELADKDTPADPLGEKAYEPVPGLIHRYRNRVVVLVTNNCAVRCRHCTRKNSLNRSPAENIESRLPQILKYIRRKKKIREVILSGGDPLLLETAVLDGVMAELTAIKHVEVLRIGTRAPVVLPMRIDAELCACLAKHRPLWINTQFNHPREITAEAEKACRSLQQSGLPVSNQTVLLRGVNDSLPVLAKLFNNLQRIMVRPYYAFRCDPVRGVRHFITRKSASAELSARLRQTLGGLSMPLFVADLPGRKSKIPLECARRRETPRAGTTPEITCSL
ncbi:MAG: KamA family radical SAM protein [Kiritimatiellae bacterium]|nr:KamA family radical SAM protein [Kiritimatiellia bacterium]